MTIPSARRMTGQIRRSPSSSGISNATTWGAPEPDALPRSAISGGATRADCSRTLGRSGSAEATAVGVGCGAGVGCSVGVGCGARVGAGVGVGCGTGVGAGVGVGCGTGVGAGVGVGCGTGVGVRGRRWVRFRCGFRRWRRLRCGFRCWFRLRLRCPASVPALAPVPEES